MENILKEQIPDSPLAEAQAAAKDKAEGISFGKFKSKEGLMEAYNSLEAEFTRRSQRIKELETQLNTRSTEEKWDKKVDDLTAKYPVAKELTAEIGEYIAQKNELLGDENCLEKALLAVLSTRYKDKPETLSDKKDTAKEKINNAVSLRDKAEAEFKEGQAAVPEVLPPGGELPAAPRVHAKSVREAGDMARKLLKTV